ncbi:hypothetical protein PMZ80_000919 [Knufia obscura]|uniref:Uncharacterized protein n=1 Tax=Knufia obscura TaxID=1635080 RepID=A0ABR0S1V0_9EURO|nr:hypothetical protein PMZ80_000919 [Knufia obscura]
MISIFGFGLAMSLATVTAVVTAAEMMQTATITPSCGSEPFPVSNTSDDPLPITHHLRFLDCFDTAKPSIGATASTTTSFPDLSLLPLPEETLAAERDLRDIYLTLQELLDLRKVSYLTWEADINRWNHIAESLACGSGSETTKKDILPGLSMTLLPEYCLDLMPSLRETYTNTVTNVDKIATQYSDVAASVVRWNKIVKNLYALVAIRKAGGCEDVCDGEL